MAEGYSFSTFGAIVGTGRTTLYEWVARYPEFKKAKQRGESLAQMYWETLKNRKLNGDKDIDTTLLIFTLKTRFYKDYGDKSKLQIDVQNKTVEDLVIEAKKKQLENKPIEEVEYKEVTKEKTNGIKRTKRVSKK